MLRFLNKSYKTIRDYGVGEFIKRLFIFFDRKIRLGRYYHLPQKKGKKALNVESLLFVSGEPKNATSYYRCEIPARQLEMRGWQVDIVFEKFAEGVDVANYKYIVFYRTPLSAVCGIFEQARQRGIKTIFSVDDFVYRRDLIENLDYTKALFSEDAELLLKRADGMLALMQEVDAGIASTKYLAEDMKKHIQGEVFVNRNGILDEKRKRLKLKAENQKIILGYFSGSETHDRDFEIIWPAVKNILEEDENFELWLGGRIDKRKFATGSLSSRIKHLPFMSREKYMETLAGIDINLLPLENTEFNRGKSEIKFLEAALCEVPTVASAVGDLASVIKNMETGMIVESSEKWYEVLRNFIRSEQRGEIAKNAKNWVEKNYSLDSLGSQLELFLLELYKGK
ncbi:glycosyltransferase [Candidatus Dojkabacteria bacterium]|nr:glycosyltransferase [Candidatus Dojkabacteria bacterium]